MKKRPLKKLKKYRNYKQKSFNKEFNNLYSPKFQNGGFNIENIPLLANVLGIDGHPVLTEAIEKNNLDKQIPLLSVGDNNLLGRIRRNFPDFLNGLIQSTPFGPTKGLAKSGLKLLSSRQLKNNAKLHALNLRNNLFNEYIIEPQIDKVLSDKEFFKNGGSLNNMNTHKYKKLKKLKEYKKSSKKYQQGGFFEYFKGQYPKILNWQGGGNGGIYGDTAQDYYKNLLNTNSQNSNIDSYTNTNGVNIGAGATVHGGNPFNSTGGSFLSNQINSIKNDKFNELNNSQFNNAKSNSMMETGANIFSLMKGQEAYDTQPKENLKATSTAHNGFKYYQHGGAFGNSPLVNATGYTPGTSTYNNPFNIIPGGDISMKNTPFPLMAKPNRGKAKILQPGKSYNFPKADYVTEVPLNNFQFGGDLGNNFSEIAKQMELAANNGVPVQGDSRFIGPLEKSFNTSVAPAPIVNSNEGRRVIDASTEADKVVYIGERATTLGAAMKNGEQYSYQPISNELLNPFKGSNSSNTQNSSVVNTPTEKRDRKPGVTSPKYQDFANAFTNDETIAIQKAAGIEQDGIIGPITYDAIVNKGFNMMHPDVIKTLGRKTKNKTKTKIETKSNNIFAKPNSKGLNLKTQEESIKSRFDNIKGTGEYQDASLFEQLATKAEKDPLGLLSLGATETLGYLAGVGVAKRAKDINKLPNLGKATKKVKSKGKSLVNRFKNNVINKPKSKFAEFTKKGESIATQRYKNILNGKMANAAKKNPKTGKFEKLIDNRGGLQKILETNKITSKMLSRLSKKDLKTLERLSKNDSKLAEKLFGTGKGTRVFQYGGYNTISNNNNYINPFN